MLGRYVHITFPKKSFLGPAINGWIAIRKALGKSEAQADAECAPFMHGAMSVIKFVRMAIDNNQLDRAMKVLETDVEVFMMAVKETFDETKGSN